PDIVFPKYRAVLFAHGCFWHGHSCHLFKWPQSKRTFWINKLTRNQARDVLVIKQLRADGWRILIVWECALKGRTRISTERVIEPCAQWLRSSRTICEIKGA